MTSYEASGGDSPADKNEEAQLPPNGGRARETDDGANTSEPVTAGDSGSQPMTTGFSRMESSEGCENEDGSMRSLSPENRQPMEELLLSCCEDQSWPQTAPVREIGSMSLHEIEKELSSESREVTRQISLLERGSKVLARHAWRCGKLLVHAKSLVEKLGDKFGEWLEECWVEPTGLCQQTARRYMQLARQFQTEDAMFSDGGDSLREIYLRLGVLKEEKQTTAPSKDDDENDDRSPVEAALEKIELLKRLVRRAVKKAADRPVSPEDRAKVEAARRQINDYLDQLLDPIPELELEESPSDKLEG